MPIVTTAAANTHRRGKGNSAGSSNSNSRTCPKPLVTHYTLRLPTPRGISVSNANANVHANATADGKATIQGSSTTPAPDPAPSTGKSSALLIRALPARARSLRIRPDPRKRKISTDAAVRRKEAIWRSFQQLNGHCKTQALVCLWTGTFGIERAHMLSHSPRHEYRSKSWLRVLGLEDHLSTGIGEERRHLTPALRRVLNLVDYRPALLESPTTSQWPSLKRPSLPFAHPPIPMLGAIQDKGRHYTHCRSRAPPPSTEEADYSSSPPVNYRTSSIFECLGLAPSSPPVTAKPMDNNDPSPTANIQSNDDEGDDRFQRRYKRG